MKNSSDTISTMTSVICFNPVLKRLIYNIQSVAPQTNEILIIDNHSNNFSKIKREIQKATIGIETPICWIENKRNIGVATALNKSLKYALTKGYEWILTLDQDSICSRNMVYTMLNSIKTYDHKKNVAVLAPQIHDINFFREKKHYPIKERFKKVKTVITSGSLVNTKVAELVGGFEEKLFIDYVDHEFCLRINKYGFEVIQVPRAVLFHEVGKITSHNMLFFKVATTNHIPVRRYFIYRNKFFTYRKYFLKFPFWVLRDALSGLKSIFIIILFETNKIEKLKMILKGIFDGFFGKFCSNPDSLFEKEDQLKDT